MGIPWRPCIVSIYSTIYHELVVNTLKPDVTFFGEALPEQAIQEAFLEAQRADLMLIPGSTLIVQPAASLPLYILQNGGEIVIVNNQPTLLDHQAVLKYDDLEGVFRFVNEYF